MTIIVINIIEAAELSPAHRLGRPVASETYNPRMNIGTRASVLARNLECMRERLVTRKQGRVFHGARVDERSST